MNELKKKSFIATFFLANEWKERSSRRRKKNRRKNENKQNSIRFVISVTIECVYECVILQNNIRNKTTKKWRKRDFFCFNFISLSLSLWADSISIASFIKSIVQESITKWMKTFFCFSMWWPSSGFNCSDTKREREKTYIIIDELNEK